MGPLHETETDRPEWDIQTSKISAFKKNKFKHDLKVKHYTN